MNWTIIIIEAIVMTIAFTAMVLIPLVKNPVWWIHDYPQDIQEGLFITFLCRISQKFGVINITFSRVHTHIFGVPR